MKRIQKMSKWLLVLVPLLLLWAVPAMAQTVSSVTLPSVSLQVKEVVLPASDYSVLPGAEFTFVLEGMGSAPMPSGSTGNTKRITLTAPQAAKGTVALSGSFGSMADVPVGVYTYTIRQEAPSSDAAEKRFAYDKAVYTLYLVVEWKDGLVNTEIVSIITLSRDDVKLDEPELSFLNSTVAVDPPIRKVVVGNPPTSPTFQFEMKADNASHPMPEGASGDTKVISTGAGEVEFGWMHFTSAGTYTYTLREIPGSDDTFTYDTNRYQIKVVVTETGGQLNATRSITKIGGDGTLLMEALFTNTYTDPVQPPPSPVGISFPNITKALTGSVPSSSSVFHFEITGVSTDTPARVCPMPKNGTSGYVSVSIVGAATISMGHVTFTEAGDYVYTITEKDSGVNGYTYSKQQYKVYINIRADQNGSLQMVRQDIYVDGNKVDKIIFTNNYTASGGGGGGGGSVGGPKTGDLSNTELLWASLGGSFIGMLLCLWFPKAKKRMGL